MRQFPVTVLVFFCLIAFCGCTQKMTREEKAAETGRIMARAFIEELAKLARESLKKAESEEAARALARAFAEELQRLAEDSFKEKELRSNMHRTQLVLEDFSTMAEGAYPVERNQMVRDILVTFGFPRMEKANQSIDALLPSSFRNPFSEKLPALSVSQKDPPDWSLELLGQVIWVPVKLYVPKEGTPGMVARGYKIYGAGPLGLLDLVLEYSQ